MTHRLHGRIWWTLAVAIAALASACAVLSPPPTYAPFAADAPSDVMPPAARDSVRFAAAVQRGVRVRALIAHANRGGENRLRKLEQRLLAAGVTVTRTADDLLRYHAKYMVADDVLHVSRR